MSLNYVRAALVIKGKDGIIEPLPQLVLIHLCNHVKDDGTDCFPSIALIAERSGLSERSVIRAIEWLVENNLVARQKRFSTSNLYHLLFPPLKPKTKTKNDY